MVTQEESKLTGEVKMPKTPPVILTSNGARGKDLKKAVEVLRRGGIVIFPTDTVYGIGCRFDSETAIQRIKNIKKSHQDFPILISDFKQLHQLAQLAPTALYLVQKYWPGALTLVLKSKRGNEKIALRMPDSDLVRTLINTLGAPIIGTSANFHGQKASTKYAQLDKKLIDMTDYVIRGECKLGKESTVVDATTIPVKILRQGAVRIYDNQN